MKCQNLFSGKYMIKINVINLPSAELAQRVLTVKSETDPGRFLSYSLF